MKFMRKYWRAILLVVAMLNTNWKGLHPVATAAADSAAGVAARRLDTTPDEAKTLTAKADISNLHVALDSFELDNGRYPTTQEGLNALVEKPPGDLPGWHKYIDALPKDPWRNPYVYACPGSNKEDFDLFSRGPDGKPGTADDVK